MRPVAGVALSVSAMFLLIEAILINSAALFYMSTAMIVTIAASRVQAYLSVQALSFERTAPAEVEVGDVVTVEITVMSDRRIRRPLVSIFDNLPKRLLLANLTPSMPIAPSNEQPLKTQYQFRPLKRGTYKWSSLTARGTDALGLVTMAREYRTDPAEIIVLPKSIPVLVDLPMSSGWGADETETGKMRGTGLEPRGIREYVSGDSLRHVHWRSSARAGRLLVKEFETGSHAQIGFALQRQAGSEMGEGADTSLETMCGQVTYLSEVFLRQGAKVVLPTIENGEPASTEAERLRQIKVTLAKIDADQSRTLSDEILESGKSLSSGSVLYALLSIADPGLPKTASILKGMGVQMVALIYDTKAYKSSKGHAPASGEAFLDQLRASGIRAIMMPTQGNHSHGGST